jgi:hypothetical protein
MVSAAQDNPLSPSKEPIPVTAPESLRIGFLRGLGSIGPEFFDPLPEDELRLWNGESD